MGEHHAMHSREGGHSPEGAAGHRARLPGVGPRCRTEPEGAALGVGHRAAHVAHSMKQQTGRRETHTQVAGHREPAEGSPWQKEGSPSQEEGSLELGEGNQGVADGGWGVDVLSPLSSLERPSNMV